MLNAILNYATSIDIAYIVGPFRATRNTVLVDLYRSTILLVLRFTSLVTLSISFLFYSCYNPISLIPTLNSVTLVAVFCLGLRFNT